MIIKDVDTCVGIERKQTFPRKEQVRLPPWSGVKEDLVWGLSKMRSIARTRPRLG